MAGENTPMRYGDGTDSTAGAQFRTNYYNRKALEEVAPEQYFTPLADTTKMPRNYGKEIKQYHYLRILDDRNDNDQGLDAAGSVISKGNLWGSSKDIGTITGKLPVMNELGGRVNRVGSTRLTLTGSFYELGFFEEFTEDSYLFDTDRELMTHLHRERLSSASEQYEAILQKDLLEGAGVTVFGGVATSDAEMTGEGANISKVSYDGLKLLDRTLTDNLTPRDTPMLTGSSMTDTRTISGGRLMHIGSETQTLYEKMTDFHGNPAFVPVHQYGGQSSLKGEIGTVAGFRIIVVPQMQHWAGVGATATSSAYRSTDVNGTDKYDVYPGLVIGAKSFTTIGFNTDGKSTKFRIFTKMPGKEMVTSGDPYGKKGLSSITYYYGTMILRAERIGLIKTVAEV